MPYKAGTVEITELDLSSQSVTFLVSDKAINGQPDPEPRRESFTAEQLQALPVVSPTEISHPTQQREWSHDSYQTYELFGAVVAWQFHVMMEGIWEGTEVTITGPFLVRETR